MTKQENIKVAVVVFGITALTLALYYHFALKHGPDDRRQAVPVELPASDLSIFGSTALAIGSML